MAREKNVPQPTVVEASFAGATFTFGGYYEAWEIPTGPLDFTFPTTPLDRAAATQQLEALLAQIRPGSPAELTFRAALDRAIREAQQATSMATPGPAAVMRRLNLRKSRFYELVSLYIGRPWKDVEAEYAFRWHAERSGKNRNPGGGQ